ncbi:hypothetical protein [Streptomyces xanthochromogenes]|uniref:hypothetical protein n=1 Tax=Streptomyces xanthochromogenes TaxID=67384 RepID=UPI0034232B7E
MVVGADIGADGAVQVVGPQGVGVLGDERAFHQAPGGGLVGEAGSLGGQVQVKGVEERCRAQQVPLLRGEVGQDAGQQGGEGVVEVLGEGFAGTADFQEAADREVQVQGEPVGAGGDRGADEGLAAVDEAAGEVVVAVLGGEVTDQVLAAAGPVGQAGPGSGSGPVELPVQGGIGPRQAGAATDDEVHVGKEPHQALQEAFEVAVAVGGVLEGVQQHHRRDPRLHGHVRQIPGQQVQIVGQGLEVGGGLQQGRGPRGAGQGSVDPADPPGPRLPMRALLDLNEAQATRVSLELRRRREFEDDSTPDDKRQADGRPGAPDAVQPAAQGELLLASMTRLVATT